MAHSLLASVAMQERKFEDAITEGERAVAIHPGDAEAYHMLAMVRIYNGDFMEGARLEQRSLRLNPLALENSLVELGRAYFHMGRLDDAVTVLERVCRAKPNWLSARTLLAGCHCEGGHPDLARQVAAAILRIKPDFSLAWWSQLQLYRRNEDLEHHLSGLRLLGLPAVASRVDSRAPAEPDLQGVAPDRPSLAVLPFENLSQDAALSLVADGLVEDVISLLARIPGFFVIARRSSFFYRDRSLDLRRVGRELGIRYVVAGSLRSSGPRLRIVVNLFEVESGMQHWAQQYDVERGDAFEIQSNIAGDITAELQPQLTRAELTNIRRQRPDNLGAWAHYHAAVGAITLEGFNEQSLASAIDHLGKATELDQDFALAYSLKALWGVTGVSLSLLPDAADQYSAREAERAVALDPNGPEVIAYAGCAFVRMGDVCHGRELIERAVELDPSNPQARVTLGATQVRAGEFERGIENMRLGIRSSPRDYGLTFWGMGLAIALSRAGRVEEALSQAQSVCRRDGGLYMARVVMALLLARLKREVEARAAIAEARRIRPALSLKEIARFLGDPVATELETAWK
jgi:TolB-like protein/Flp pilus assembly protein TadD